MNPTSQTISDFSQSWGHPKAISCSFKHLLWLQRQLSSEVTAHSGGCNLVLKGSNKDVTSRAGGGCLSYSGMKTAIHLEPALHQGAKSYPLRVRLSLGHPVWAGWKTNCDGCDCSGNWGQVWFPRVRLNSSSTTVLQALKLCRFSWVPPQLEKKMQGNVTAISSVSHLYNAKA